MRRTRTAAVLAVTLVTVLAVTGCSFGEPDQPDQASTPNLPAPTGDRQDPPSSVATVIAENLSIPWGITFLPDGAALVTERATKRILQIGPGSAVATWRTIEDVAPAGEGGLLGIAVSPDYDTDGTVFIYYTTADDNRIARLTHDGPVTPILTGIPKGSIHNGGRLAFGPDGYLYATTGETGNRGLAQELDSLAGKILRLAPDGQPAPGNPFPSAPYVWSYGHRNVQGLAWDSTGRLFATEFGQDTWDEINLIEPGQNYGWPMVEGIGGQEGYVDPIWVKETNAASCSGAAFSGSVFVAACLGGQRLWLVPIGVDGTVVSPPVASFVGTYGRLRAAQVAPDGSIWVSTSNRDGRGTVRDGDDKLLRVIISGEGAGETSLL